MGRKTHESIGKPLPGRLNIVMTHDRSFHAEGCVVVHDTTEALRAAEGHGSGGALVIGGGQIYASFLPMANTIYLTRVHATPEGEAHFTFDEGEWEPVSVEEHPANGETDDQHPFTFITLKRRLR
jgi:dihydrofolate reductase